MNREIAMIPPSSRPTWARLCSALLFACCFGAACSSGPEVKRALAIGEKLGVYRDYPCSKGCTSPFAPTWINEMVKRKG